MNPMRQGMRTGRPRNANARRDSAGRSIESRETVEERMAVVLAQPHRRWAANPRDERLAYPLGRLHYSGYITTDQFNAANWWHGVVRAYGKITGIPVPHPRGSLGSMVGSFTDGGFYRWEQGAEDDEEEQKRVKRVKDDYDDCHDRLIELGRVHGVGRQILLTCKRICILEENEIILWQGEPDKHEMGNLRLGLNALDKIRQ